MILKLLGGLLLFTACGKQVNIDHTALKNASQLSAKDAMNEQKTGSLVKMSTSNIYLQYNNNSYKVSSYSSPITLKFLETHAQKATYQIAVIFKGRISSGEMIISEISSK